MNSALKCNLMTCNQILGENTYLLSCGHAVCEDHGKTLGSTCPVCSVSTSVLIKNFSQTYILQTKKMRMIGYSPRDVLESSSIAIEFWNYQKSLNYQQNLQNSNKNTGISYEKFRKLESDYGQLLLNFNTLKEKYSQLFGFYTAIKENSAQSCISKGTPLIFDPPSNQKIKNPDVKIKKTYDFGIFTPK